MFHKAVKLNYKEDTALEITFSDGVVKQFDIAIMFDKYPPLTALKDRDLFLSGKLSGDYGIIWNDDLDLEVETVYEEGVIVGYTSLPGNIEVANALAKARAFSGISQSALADRTGIDQSDISKIERGLLNPSITTLKRLAAGLNADLEISFSFRKAI